MDLNRMEFGRRVRTYRVAKNISREELAEAVDCSKKTIDKLENGDTNLAAITLYRVASELGVSTSKLLGDEQVEYQFQDMTDDELIACYRSASEADKARFKVVCQIIFAGEKDKVPKITYR